jgi:GNAT superfamily N-acetyltransferase
MPSTYREQVRRAKRKDRKAILGLIDSSAAWLRECKGTDQWNRPWPNRRRRNARVAQGIRHGLTWMVDDGDGVLAATITVRELGNGALWKPGELSDPAVYVSRLVVSRTHAGQGLGAALIDWAGARGFEEWGANWIRVDVWTSNLALHEYYKSQGFEHLRTLEFENEWDYPSAALFQKPTVSIDESCVAWFKETKKR